MTVLGRVTVIDDTLRATQGIVRGKELMLYQDRQHRRVQRTVSVERMLEGRHLEHALRRARRWIRNRSGESPSGQMAVFLAAFRKADPVGFEAAVEEARALHERRPAVLKEARR